MKPHIIRRLRQSLGWTQARLALVIGVHRGTVSRWERGKQVPSRDRSNGLQLLAASMRRKPRQVVSHRTKEASALVRARREIEARLNGRQIVASVSGGKDSSAMSLYLKELGIEHRRVFMDTGWESPLTYEYLPALEEVLGPITRIRATAQMEDLIRQKGMFPSRQVRFCTQELKVKPIVRFLKELIGTGIEPVNAVGIRAAESQARSQLAAWEWQDGFDCEVWRPILEWTEQEVIAIHARHGLRPNPLYLLGARRVGCWPCIHARKSEVRLIADTDPDRIVRLRVLEDEVTQAARTRAELAGRTLSSSPSWFMNPLRRVVDGKREGGCWPIERVVAWSRTAYRGARQTDRDEFLLAAGLDGCMRWGLCETSASHAANDRTPAIAADRALG